MLHVVVQLCNDGHMHLSSSLRAGWIVSDSSAGLEQRWLGKGSKGENGEGKSRSVF